MMNPEHLVPTPYPLILASNSPRRRELLDEAGYTFTVMPPEEDVECGVCSETGPAGFVAELAFRKAKSVRERLLKDFRDCGFRSNANPKSEFRNPQFPIVLAADTVAECDGMILGKPRDEADARAMLSKLSGREHRVFSGVCLWPIHSQLEPGQGSEQGVPLVRVAVTRLRMDRLTEAQLSEYLASGQWEGKAGAFGYQDRLGWVHVVEGSESNVVGLPLEILAEMLADVTGRLRLSAAPDDAGEIPLADSQRKRES
jgi:septum formation protein